MLYLFQIPDSLKTINIIQEADTFFSRLTVMGTVYIPRLFIGIVLLYFGFKIINKLMGSVDKALKNNNFDADLRPFLVGIIRVFFKFILAVSAGGIVGVETTSFVAILAAAGFAVGLAFQGSLSNFAGGLLILFFKPFRTGDLISVGEYMGRVKEISILYTVLETLTKRKVIVPNSLLSNGVVENITGAGIIRIDLVFSIDYNSGDIDQAREVIMEVIRGCPYAETSESYQHEVLVKALANSSVDLVAWVWAKGEVYWETYFFMQEYVKKAFDKAKISIPFPQMDVHVHNEK